MSSAYHPQTDGQSERVNQCLEIYLRCFTHACPAKWSQFLSLAEFWYNNCHQSAINMTPFVALYGKEPRHWGIDAVATSPLPQLADWLEERKLIQQLLQHNLNHARQQMKHQADKNWTFRSFSQDEEVFVKLQPYVQSSVARRANHKLSFRYFGPYTIQRVINPVAYEVKLPEGSKILPIFHVSQLRKVLRPGTPVSPVLPVLTEDIAMPVKILARRWHRGPHGRREQVQVQWSDPAALDITWEDKEELHQRFPAATAWGQAVTEEGGDVRRQTTPGAVTEEMGLTQHRPRPKRIVQPNRRHVGPEWTK
jgi:hypothetical protein